MSFLETAFANLHFAFKLMAYAEDGRIGVKELDRPMSWIDGQMQYHPPDQIFKTTGDLFLAFQNNTSIAFGTAAITLNYEIEAAGHEKPAEISSASDQCIALTYQIRNAFAHNMANPTWLIHRLHHRRKYEFGSVFTDLTELHGNVFRYEHIGGPEGLIHIKDFAVEHLLPSKLE